MNILKGIPIVFLILGLAVHAHAVRVRQVSLEDMASSAKVVFEGECTGKVSQFDKDLGQEIYLFTFRVDRVLKGDPGKTYVVKVMKLLADQKQITTFEKGEKLVLFLRGESRLGFSCPVGLGQGRFKVVDSGDGKKEVINENQNRGLLKGMKSRNKMRVLSGEDTAVLNESGPLDYDRFMSLTETLIQE